MKTLLSLSFFFLLSISLINCGTSAATADASVGNTKKNTDNYANLADYLRSKGSVSITGYDEASIRLQIRGINSVMGDTRPYIYIDGMPIGRDYKQANQALNPNNIKSVRVLSSLSELAIYGENGNSGIILIKTKSGKS